VSRLNNIMHNIWRFMFLGTSVWNVRENWFQFFNLANARVWEQLLLVEFVGSKTMQKSGLEMASKWVQFGQEFSVSNVKNFVLKQPVTYRLFHKPISFLLLVSWSMGFSKPQLLASTLLLVDGSLVWFFDLLLETIMPWFYICDGRCAYEFASTITW
jgi:hypothetical protein